MKKLFYLSMMAMLLAFTSCLKDDFASENSGNERNVKLSINIPQKNTDSRAAHSNPALTNMRLFLYVMYDGKIVSTVNDGSRPVDLSSGYDKEIRLMAGRQYRIVAWADFGSDYYTLTTSSNTDGKDAISVAMANTTIKGSENKRDAYFYSEPFALTSDQNSIDVKMKRPFGLVKINTLDYNEGTITDEYKPAFYSTEFTNVPTAFDLLTGEANTESNITISSTDANIADFSKGELSFDYLFANDSQKNLETFTVTYSNASEQEITSYTFENIPFRRNYITNVSGNILTKQGTLNITIEKDWTDFTESVAPGNLQSTLNGLKTTEVIEANIVVTGKLPAGTSYTLPALTEGSSLNITLAGAEESSSITFGNNDFKGSLNISNQGNAMGIIINVPNGDATIGSGSWSSMEVTTKENTCIIEEDASIGTLTVNAGNVKIYGIVNSISNSGSGTIYRCLSTQKSLENLLSDDKSGYKYILIEVPAEIDGGEQITTLPKPVDIYADAKISNIIINNQETAYSAMNIYDGANTVVLNNVKMSCPNTAYSICKLLGSDLNFKAVDCEFILTQEVSNQSGLNIQNGGTNNVITAELDGCYIGFYSYDDRVNKDMNIDYDYPDGFKWSSYSRGITTGYHSEKTYDGTATTNLTIKNSFIEGAYYAINTLQNVKHNVNIDNSVLDGRAGLNIWTTSERPSFFNVKNSKFIGRNGFLGSTESFGTIVVNGRNVNDPASFKTVRNINIVVDNSDIVSDNDPQTETNRQYMLDIRTPEVASCSFKFINGTTLREITNPRLSYFVSMNYWNHDVVSADETVKLIGMEGVLLMPQKVWDGTRITKPHSTSSFKINDGTQEFSYTCYTIVEPSELAWFAEKVNSGDETIKDKGLYFPTNLDLGGHEWTPIGCYGGKKSFKGLVLGAGSTISNLHIEKATSEKAGGLFGVVNGTILDLKIENASIKHVVDGNNGGVGVVAGAIYPSGSIEEVTVTNATIESNRWTGGIAGYIYGSVNNCTVEGISLTATPDLLSEKYDNGDKVGGIVGYSAADNHGTISGNTAKSVTIKGYRDLGGIAGAAAATKVTENSVTNINITVDQKTGNYGEETPNAGYIIGRILDSNSIDGSNKENGTNSIETL